MIIGFEEIIACNPIIVSAALRAALTAELAAPTGSARRELELTIRPLFPGLECLLITPGR